MTLIKMFFGVVKTLFTICWRIVKFLSGPMRDSLKGLWNLVKLLYKNHKEKKAVSAANVDEGASAVEPSSSDETKGDETSAQTDALAEEK